MNKSIIVAALLAVFSAPNYAQNSSQHSANGTGKNAGSATDNRSSEQKKKEDGVDSGPRAAGAGPSVPKTGDGAATSDKDSKDSTSGQSSGNAGGKQK